MSSQININPKVYIGYKNNHMNFSPFFLSKNDEDK